MSLADDILKKSVAGAKDTPAASAQEGTSEATSLLSLNSLSDKVPKAKKEDDKPAATPVSMPVADAPSSNLLANANKGNAALSLSTLVGNFERKAPEKADHSGGFAVGTAVGFGQNIVGQVTGVVDIFIKKDDDSSTLIARATGQKTGNESALNNALKTAGQIANAGGDLAGEGVDKVLGTNLSSGKTSSAIGKAVDKVKSDWNTGDSYTRGQIFGNVLGFGATAFVGGAGVAKTSRALTGNAAELRMIATGYKEANLAMESINVLRSGTGLTDDALKIARTSEQVAAKTTPLLGNTAEAFLSPLRQATEGLGARNLLGQGENALAHAPGANPLTKGPMMTRVDFASLPPKADLGVVARTAETNAGRGAGAVEGQLTHVRAPGANIVDDVTGRTPKGLVEPPSAVITPKDGAALQVAKPGTGVVDNVAPGTGSVADNVVGRTGNAADNLAVKGQAEQVVAKGADDVVRPQGTVEVVKPQGTAEVVKPQGTAEVVKPQGTVEVVKPQGALDDVAIKPGAADDAIKAGTNAKPVEVPSGAQRVEAVQPKLEVVQPNVEVPGVAVNVERAPLAAVEASTQQVIASGTKFGDNVAQIASTASGTAISSNLDEIVRLTRTLGQGADDLALSQIKKNIDDIARSGGDDIANQLRRGLDDVERHSAVSTTARTLQTTTETLTTQTANFGDEAARLANRTRSTSPVVSEKLTEVSRLSRELGSPAVVDQAAVIRQMRTALDDIARNGGDDVARKLGSSLDDIERTSSSVRGLRLTQQVQESAVTVGKQITTITDDLATKVTGTAAPAIKEELTTLSKATDDLVKGTDAAAAVRVQESLAKLERMTVGTNVADDVSKLANHTTRLESTVAVSRTATALETTTQTVAKQATALADNVVAPAIRTQADNIAATTGSKVVTEQLDEISRLARTVGNSADDAAVLQQIKQSVNTIARNGGDDIARQLKGGIDDLERSVGNASTLKLTQKVEESALALRTQVANLGDNIVEKVPGATGPAVREELKVLSKATDDLVKGDATAAARVKESLTKIEGATRNTQAADEVTRLANQTSKLESTVAVSRTTRALETTTQTLGTQGSQLSDDMARMAQAAKTSGSAPAVVAEKLDDMSKLAAKIGTTGDDLALVSQLRRGVDDIARNGGDDIARQLRTSVDDIERTAGTANTLKLTQRVEETALNLRTQVSNLSDNVAKTPGLDAAASQAFRQELKTFTTATDDMLRGVDNTAAARVNSSLKNIEQMTTGTRFADDVARVSDDASKLQSSVNITRTARALETTTDAMVGQATRLSDDATRFATTNASTVGKVVTDKLDEVSQLSRTLGKSGDDLTTLRTIRNHLDDVSRSGGDDIARQLRTSVDDLERSATQVQTLKLAQKVDETALAIRNQVGTLSDDLLKTPTTNSAIGSTTSAALRQELKNVSRATDDLVRGVDDAAAMKSLNTSANNLQQLSVGTRLSDDVVRLVDDTRTLQQSVTVSRTARELTDATEKLVTSGTRLADDAARFATTNSGKAVADKLDEIANVSRTLTKTGDDLKAVAQIKNSVDDIARAGGDDIARQMRPVVAEIENSALQASRLKEAQRLALTVQDDAGRIAKTAKELSDSVVGTTTEARLLRQHLNTISRTADELPTAANQGAQVSKIKTAIESVKNHKGAQFVDDLERSVATLDANVVKASTNKVFAEQGRRIEGLVTSLQDDLARANQGLRPLVMPERTLMSDLAKIEVQTGKLAQTLKQGGASTADNAAAQTENIAAIRKTINEIAQNGHTTIAQNLNRTINGIDEAIKIQKFEQLAANSEVLAATLKRQVADIPATSANPAVQKLQQAVADLPATSSPQVVLSTLKDGVKAVEGTASGATIAQQLTPTITRLETTVTQQQTLANELVASTASTIESQIRGIQTAGRLSGQQQAIAAATENVQFVRHLTAQADPRMALQAELTQQHLTKLELASRAASSTEVARAGGNKVLAMAEMGHEAASNRVLLQGLTPEGAKFRSMVTNSNTLSRVNDLVKSGTLLVGLVKDRQVLGAVLRDSQGARAGLRYAASAAGLIGTGGYLGYNAYYHTSILPRKILAEQAENEKQKQLGIERIGSQEPVERAENVAPINPVDRRADMEFSPSVAEALKASQRRSVIPTDGIAARHGISQDDPDARIKEESLRRTSRIFGWSGKGGFVAPSADVERINVQTAKSLRIRSTTGGASGDSGIRLPKTAVAEYEFNYTKATMGLNGQNKLLASANNDGRKQVGLGGSRYGGTSSSTPMSSNLRTMIAHNAFRSEGMAHGNQVLNGAEATENTGLDQSKSGAGSTSSGPQLSMNQDGTFSVVAQTPAQDPSGTGAQPQILAAATSNTNLVDQLAQRYAAESEATV